MNFFRKIFHRHQWVRYDTLVEQLFVGGYYAWQRCSDCKKIRFASANRGTPQEPGWKEKKQEIDRIMGWKAKEYE